MTILWKHTELNYWSVLPESKGEEVEEVKCAEFGCGRSLTPAEQLFGDRCVRHSKDRKKKLVDIIDRYI